MVGLGLGALVASLVVQFAAAPARLVFDLLLILFALLAVAAFYLPETVKLQPGTWRSLMPSFTVPRHAHATMWQVLPLNTAQWALGGLYLSLGPTLVPLVTGNSEPWVGGALIATLVLSSAVAIGLVRQHTARSGIIAGAAGLAIGVTVALTGVHFHSTGAFFAGTGLAGLGFGAALSGSLRSLAPLAAPHERTGLISAFFVLSYLAFSVPAIIAGALIGRFGLQPIVVGYGSLLVVMATTSLFAMRLRARAA
jgi:hypothetical protein